MLLQHGLAAMKGVTVACLLAPLLSAAPRRCAREGARTTTRCQAAWMVSASSVPGRGELSQQLSLAF